MIYSQLFQEVCNRFELSFLQIENCGKSYLSVEYRNTNFAKQNGKMRNKKKKMKGKNVKKRQREALKIE